ncbi:autotransporter outer membrane beta-barrel domain-containing protein [Enterobacter chuandaensis]|nr:autotransporter outer membrane beta-barrel domain-containing protein [Enterobacter chuandaensis]
MKSLFKYSFLRNAILIATLGSSSSVYAITDITKDTIIDGRSPADEAYAVLKGAELTVVGATTKYINVWDGSLKMDDNSIANGQVFFNENTSGIINNSIVNGALYTSGGEVDIKNSVVNGLIATQSAGMIRAINVHAYEFSTAEGELIVTNGHFDNTGGYRGNGHFIGGGKATFNGSVIVGKAEGVKFSGIQNSSLALINSSIWSTEGATFDITGGFKKDINLSAGSRAGSATGVLLENRGSGAVALLLEGSYAAGDILAQGTGNVDVSLTEGSTLSGKMVNVNRLVLDDTSLFEMTASSDIKALTMAGGTVKFAPAEGEEYRTLTLGTLSGNGNVMMNADLLNGKSDLLDISGTANGKYTLHLAATGREAANREALALVRTGGGDAEFALNGGRLDVGAWQQQLVRNGNNWELVQAGSTSASTDAMLAMASAPQFMHEEELNVLRSRLDDTTLAPQSGMWGTALHSRSDVDGAWDSAYRLEQNGLMLGGDKVTELDAGSLSTGGYLSQSTGQVKHARGGQSRVTGYGGGLYASLTSDNGWYTRGSAQITRFSNKLSARMSDGGTARADWNSWGYGLGVEAGRHIAVNDTTRLTPFAGLNGWLTPSESVSLNNGMTAETGDGRSLQAEAGMRFSTRLDAGDVKVAPYATAALSQALVKNGGTRINETVDFTNDFTGTGGKLSGGVSVMLTPSTRVWMEAGYAKSEHAESPLVGNVGLRVDF